MFCRTRVTAREQGQVMWLPHILNWRHSSRDVFYPCRQKLSRLNNMFESNALIFFHFHACAFFSTLLSKQSRITNNQEAKHDLNAVLTTLPMHSIGSKEKVLSGYMDIFQMPPFLSGYCDACSGMPSAWSEHLGCLVCGMLYILLQIFNMLYFRRFGWHLS